MVCVESLEESLLLLLSLLLEPLGVVITFPFAVILPEPLEKAVPSANAVPLFLPEVILPFFNICRVCSALNILFVYSNSLH